MENMFCIFESVPKTELKIGIARNMLIQERNTCFLKQTCANQCTVNKGDGPHCTAVRASRRSNVSSLRPAVCFSSKTWLTFVPFGKLTVAIVAAFPLVQHGE